MAMSCVQAIDRVLGITGAEHRVLVSHGVALGMLLRGDIAIKRSLTERSERGEDLVRLLATSTRKTTLSVRSYRIERLAHAVHIKMIASKRANGTVVVIERHNDSNYLKIQG